jgi:hypothetical protein
MVGLRAELGMLAEPVARRDKLGADLIGTTRVCAHLPLMDVVNVGERADLETDSHARLNARKAATSASVATSLSRLMQESYHALTKARA